jgi:hypothetical protein
LEALVRNLSELSLAGSPLVRVYEILNSEIDLNNIVSRIQPLELHVSAEVLTSLSLQAARLAAVLPSIIKHPVHLEEDNTRLIEENKALKKQIAFTA